MRADAIEDRFFVDPLVMSRNTVPHGVRRGPEAPFTRTTAMIIVELSNDEGSTSGAAGLVELARATASA